MRSGGVDVVGNLYGVSCFGLAAFRVGDGFGELQFRFLAYDYKGPLNLTQSSIPMATSNACRSASNCNAASGFFSLFYRWSVSCSSHGE